jgi:hypothetical protein
MTQDLYNSIKVKPALNIQTISTNTTTAGNIIDTQGFESCTFLFFMGALTDGDYTVLLQEGDASNLSDVASVADGDMIPDSGGEASASFTADGDDNKVSKIAYKGTKRYVRLSIVSASTSSGAVCGALAVLGHARSDPQSTQVQSA